MSIGFKGMTVAAKTMAIDSIDLYTNPELLEKARKEFEEARCPTSNTSRCSAIESLPWIFGNSAATSHRFAQNQYLCLGVFIGSPRLGTGC
jgi:hypothetical protein